MGLKEINFANSDTHTTISIKINFFALPSSLSYNYHRFGYISFFGFKLSLYHQKTEDMKIVITGSLGHISKPLADILLQKGHLVTVVSSNSEKQTDIEALGAKAAIGSIEDANFLTTVFAGADVVYCMEPPINFFTSQANLQTHWTVIARNYAEAMDQWSTH